MKSLTQVYFWSFLKNIQNTTSCGCKKIKHNILWLWNIATLHLVLKKKLDTIYSIGLRHTCDFKRLFLFVAGYRFIWENFCKLLHRNKVNIQHSDLGLTKGQQIIVDYIVDESMKGMK